MDAATGIGWEGVLAMLQSCDLQAVLGEVDDYTPACIFPQIQRDSVCRNMLLGLGV